MEANVGYEFSGQNGETFKHAAVDYLAKHGSPIEAVAAELGISPNELKTWQRIYATQQARPAKPLTGIARLRAENEALRAEILQLQVQWDILKTTLGVLSTTAGGGREYASA